MGKRLCAVRIVAVRVNVCNTPKELRDYLQIVQRKDSLEVDLAINNHW